MSWQFGPKTIEVDGGLPVVVELVMPDRGEIKQIAVSQLNGADDGTFRIFSASAAAESAAAEAREALSEDEVESSSIAPAPSLGLDAAPLDAVTYAVTPEMEIVNGAFSMSGLSYHYQNKEGGSNSVRVRKLYLVIYMATAGTAQLAVAITIEQPHLNAY